MSTFTITSGDNSTGPFGAGTGEGYADDTIGSPGVVQGVGFVTPNPSTIGSAEVSVCAYVQNGNVITPSQHNSFMLALADPTLLQTAFTSISFTDKNGVVETYLTSAAGFSNSAVAGNAVWYWPAVLNFPFTNGVQYVMTVAAPTPPTFQVPGVIGLSLAAAEAAIIAAGFTVGTVSTASNAFISAGNVSSQTPVGGTLEVAGFAVALTESLGAVVPTIDLQARFVDAKVFKAIMVANPGTINPRVYPPEVDTTARVLPPRILS